MSWLYRNIHEIVLRFGGFGVMRRVRRNWQRSLLPKVELVRSDQHQRSVLGEAPTL